ncbi:unnamed protein product [Pylaiella littoralis]
MEPSRSSRVKACLLYFFLFMSYGCVAPFMPLIWRSKGLSEHQVGILGAIKPVASFFATPVLCAFADKHSIQQQLVYAALLLYAVTRPSVLFAGTFFAAAAVEASCSFSKSPLGSLIDSAIRHSFGGDGYGALRLWGAIGFGIASLIGGYVCDAYGGSYRGVMVVFVTNVVLALVASTGVPVGRRKDDEYPEDTSGDERELVEREKNLPGRPSGREGTYRDDEMRPEVLVSTATAATATKAAEAAAATATATTTVSATGRAAATTAAAAAAAAADSFLGRYDDNDDFDGDQSQTNVALLSWPAGTSSDKNKTASGRNGSGGKGGARANVREEGGVLMAVRIMVSTDQSASFFTAVGLSGMGAGVIDTFLFISQLDPYFSSPRLEELGGSHVLCGLARLIMCVAEVPFFYLSGPLIRRLGVRGVIGLTQLAYLTRFIYYATLREPWWVLPAEVLHGLTFAAMWAATTDYAHGIAPAHLRTTIQGVVSGLHWGLGFGLGAILGGVLYAGLGAQRCFAVSGVLPSLSLLLLALPTVRRWCSNNNGGGRLGAEVSAGSGRDRGWGWGGGAGRLYELVGKDSSITDDDRSNGNDGSSSIDVVGETTHSSSSSSSSGGSGGIDAADHRERRVASAV